MRVAETIKKIKRPLLLWQFLLLLARPPPPLVPELMSKELVLHYDSLCRPKHEGHGNGHDENDEYNSHGHSGLR